MSKLLKWLRSWQKNRVLSIMFVRYAGALMFFRKRIWALKYRYTQHYHSIEDLPIWNFKKVQETKNLNYLRKLKDYEKVPKNSFYLEPLWDKIFFEWVAEFGEGQATAEYRRAKTMFWIYFWKYQETGEKKLINDIKRYEKIIADMEKSFNTDYKFSKEVEVIERHRGIILDVKTLPTIKWYRYVEALEAEARKNKNNGRRKENK